MLAFGSLAFLTPWLLTALITLPVLWWLLRAIPPAPARRAFPGVRLLLGLTDPERMPERTPWWLLLLRMVALAAAILAFANPVLNPRNTEGGSGPLLVVMDASWASAPAWPERVARVRDALDGAARDGRPTHLHLLTDPVPAEGLSFQDAQTHLRRLQGLAPAAWAPDRAAFATWLDSQDARFDSLWLTDDLTPAPDFVAALQARGSVRIIRTGRPVLALSAPVFEDGAVRASLHRSRADAPLPPLSVDALGLDPNGVERKLGSAEALFEADATSVDVSFDLPLELRNRITRIALPAQRSAGTVALSDDGLKRRKIGLVAGRQAREEQRLVEPLHYLRIALAPSADLIEASITDILNAAPDVVILADVGTVTTEERDRLLDWLDSGGLLLRFAGPRLAQSGDGQLEEDPLLPVRLRAGGRSVGGAMSWGAPKTLRPFAESSPFFGLDVPQDVAVRSQVMAQPDPNLPERVMAALEDGTPLVTGRRQGDGRVVLFHVTANAEWSSLPISGLFVQMLERLAVSTRAAQPEAADLEGETWAPLQVLDGYGTLGEAGLLSGVDGADLISQPVSAIMPPGLYEAGDRRIARNVLGANDTLTPLGPMPATVIEESFDVEEEQVLKPWLLLLALALLAIDILATLWVAGRLTGPRLVSGAAKVSMLALALGLATHADAQEAEDLALLATTETVLAYVQTGDPRVDQISEAGMAGLTLVLNRRTAIEPVAPVAVDIERDEISFFPFLYWPVTELQEIPSDAAYAKLNTYLRSGGMILFDTRDSNLGAFGSGTPNGRMLQRLAAKLDIPPLEPAPEDHVLTRTFYLLQDFPGRYARAPIWVEAAQDLEEVEGMPFRNLNDGVTPVVIGGNDWAAAWAVTAQGQPMFPVGRGAAGGRQRELAYRFGVNLIMHVMTGNYKSDQVHVPTLLERLGQ